MKAGKLITQEYNRADWLKMGTQVQRRQWAKENALAWVMEYQPLIRLEGRGDAPFEPYWSQQNWLTDDDQLRLMNKTRQSGYTTTAGAGEIPHDMIHLRAQTIIVLSKSETEATNLMDKFYLAYDSVKDKDPDWSPYVKKNAGTCILENGNKFQVLTSSKGSGRSFTGSHVYMDEAAFIMYMRSIYEGSFPTVSRSGGRYTIFSTPEPGTKFEEMCDNHEDMGFSYHQYEWWFVPEYNPYYQEFIAAYLAGDKAAAREFIQKARGGDWYRKMLAAIGEMSFLKEFECNFDAGVGKVFTSKQLGNAFRQNYLEQDDEAYGEKWTMDTEGYDEFYVFIDYGRKRDPTVIKVFGFDKEEGKWRCVQYQRIRPAIFEWSLVIGEIMATYEAFGHPDMYHDGTGSGDALTLELAGYSTPIIISDTVNSRVKTNAIVNLGRAFDNEAIILPKIPQIYNEFKKYQWKDTNLVQDCVMTVMMAMMKLYIPDDSFVGIDKSFSFTGS